jgi:hypothetical protein
MSIHDNHSHGDDACAKPFSFTGSVIIGVLAAWTISWRTCPAAADVDLSIDAFFYASSSELMKPN